MTKEKRRAFGNPDLFILITILLLFAIVWFPIARYFNVPKPIAFAAIPIAYALFFWRIIKRPT